MMNRNTGRILLFGLLVVISLGVLRDYIIDDPDIIVIPQPEQFQQALNEKGYNLDVDGKIGPRTLAAYYDYCERTRQ